MISARQYGAGNPTFFWALSIPNFLPLDGREAINAALLDAVMAEPEMHFINGVCAAITAADTWFHSEERLVKILLRIKDEALKAGTFLPMGGAMPEKLGAPPGNIYHDIRPQAFAMGSWLAAWASLGLRRLPYGLALRPTNAFEKLINYPWRGKILDLSFEYPGRTPALDINGTRICGTLQLPERSLLRDRNAIRLVEGHSGPLLLRSTVQLDEVRIEEGHSHYALTCYGLSSLWFDELPAHIALTDSGNTPLFFSRSGNEIRFTAHGAVQLVL